MHNMWQNNYHYFAEEYINAIDVCCLGLLSSSHEYKAVESH